MKKKAIKFSKNCFSSRKRFFGHEECSLDNPPELSWLKVQEYLVVAPKSLEKDIFLQKDNFFLSKRCSGLMKSSLDKPFQMFLLKVPKLTNQILEHEKKFPKVCFWTVFMQSRERTRNVLPFSECFCVKVWGRKKNQLFFWKHCFSQTVHLESMN